MSVTIKIDHAHKCYGSNVIIEALSVNIREGEFFTLLGPSGCGKTTTLRMIAGFESPDEGEIYLGDQPINALTPNMRDTAMVFQSYALFPHYNVYDNIAYGLKLRKVPKAEMAERIAKILDLVENASNKKAKAPTIPQASLPTSTANRLNWYRRHARRQSFSMASFLLLVQAALYAASAFRVCSARAASASWAASLSCLARSRPERFATSRISSSSCIIFSSLMLNLLIYRLMP